MPYYDFLIDCPVNCAMIYAVIVSYAVCMNILSLLSRKSGAVEES